MRQIRCSEAIIQTLLEAMLTIFDEKDEQGVTLLLGLGYATSTILSTARLWYRLGQIRDL